MTEKTTRAPKHIKSIFGNITVSWQYLNLDSTISITISADTNDGLRWQILRFHGNIQLQIL